MSERSERPELSIVGPVFDEEATIAEFHRRLQSVRDELDVTSEVVYVDDGSRDRSLELLQEINGRDPTVRVLSFSRNFGHQTAVSAGIEHARGRAVVVIDTDLQDPPEVIPELVERWQKGAEVVHAVRRDRRGEPAWRLATARTFYRLVRRWTSLDIELDSGDFRLIDRAVVDVLNRMPERDRFVRGMTAWVGFRRDEVGYDRDPRYAGESKYSLSRQLRLAIAAITSFSWVPLQLAGIIGFIVAALCLVAIPVILVLRLLGVAGLGGQTTVLVGVVFLGGLQLMFLGVIGEYLGRVYHELKARPLYVLKYDSDRPDTTA
jgi:polyisoprenyl-phosphate glycosyltransferase